MTDEHATYEPPRIEKRTEISGALMVALTSNQGPSAAFRSI